MHPTQNKTFQTPEHWRSTEKSKNPNPKPKFHDHATWQIFFVKKKKVFCKMLEDIQTDPKQKIQHYKCTRKKGQFKLQSTETKQKRHDTKRNHKTTKNKITHKFELHKNRRTCCKTLPTAAAAPWSPLPAELTRIATWISISWANTGKKYATFLLSHANTRTVWKEPKLDIC
jgi:hypothetical protein